MSSPILAKDRQAQLCALSKNLNLNQVKEQAGIVFRGKLKNIKYLSQGNLRVRELNFSVSEAIKGLEDKESLSLRELASLDSPFNNNSVNPKQEYVFFFYPPSKLGLTSLVGTEQGLVEIKDNDRIAFASRLKMKKPLLQYQELKGLYK